MVVVPAPVICTCPLTIVATAGSLLLYMTGCVVLRVLAPALKSGSPYILSGIGLNSKGTDGATAPIAKLPNMAAVVLAVFELLFAEPVGGSHEVPLFRITPRSAS